MAAHPAAIPTDTRHEGYTDGSRTTRSRKQQRELGRDMLAKIHALGSTVSRRRRGKPLWAYEYRPLYVARFRPDKQRREKRERWEAVQLRVSLPRNTMSLTLYNEGELTVASASDYLLESDGRLGLTFRNLWTNQTSYETSSVAFEG